MVIANSYEQNIFKVQPLNITHRDALIKLFSDIINDDTASAFHPHPFNQEYVEKIVTFIGQDLYLGAFLQQKLIGYGLLRGWDEQYNIPSLGIYLHPSVRGQGFAVKFMHALHDLARQKHASEVRLKVYPDNLISLKLYKRLGYKFIFREQGQLVGFIKLK